MVSMVLARKYRPRRFSEMVGQDHVVRALSNALAGGRLHHAYLFTGTRGIGKTTVSRILAKSLNCTGPDGQGGVTAEPCGQCQACTEIDADRYIDYIELDAASNRGIDEARELIERAAYKPSVGRFKVFMTTRDAAIIEFASWLLSPPGRYLLDWEQARIDHAVADLFGFHAEGRAARYRWLRSGAGGIDEAHLPRAAWRDLFLHQ